MGVDTDGYINASFSIENIRTFVQRTTGLKEKEITIESRLEAHSTMFYVHLSPDTNEHRVITIFLASDTPLGPATHISMHSDDFGRQTICEIVEFFGGWFREADSTEKWKLYRGEFWNEEGLQYFVRIATIDGKIDGNTENCDALGRYVRARKDRIYHRRKR